MESVIKVENLSKRYRLNGSTGSDTIRDIIARNLRFSKGNSLKPITGDDKHKAFWALRDINFDVKKGEILGIIGNNGAGKSTLLKIISRITKPTTGNVEIHGRVGSLLEVGTGFHLELTGRENIFLNGAIIGMKRREIERKFDEIVEFAEVKAFLDTPVKHYSSGMFMRLAFSVAAHLEPEVLLMDEVLAVGDNIFQQKCLSKMQEIMQSGHTILFVSHNMSAIARLCKRAIILNKGEILSVGETEDAIKKYLYLNQSLVPEKVWENEDDCPQDELVRIRGVRIVNETGETINATDIGNPIGIEVTYDVLQSEYILTPSFSFYNSHKQNIFVLQDTQSEWRARKRAPGRYKSVATIPANFLSEGSLTASVRFTSPDSISRLHVETEEVVGFEIIESVGNPTRGDYIGKFPGIVRPLANWETEITN